ncbi:P-loop containing nucleoside triphosphate hydrolase protein [Phlyctochytrium arcticum]|nr:P-loop containing nucleoside triphosphate hydrolase protein [Phlyctochytrium arcticum]
MFVSLQRDCSILAIHSYIFSLILFLLSANGFHFVVSEFYQKFAIMREKNILAQMATARAKQSSLPSRDPIADARHALALFTDFQKKKMEQLKAKIDLDRAALPIKPLEEQIVQAVGQHRVVLIAADTGAGKSTQVPQYLAAAGYDKIACTQPRRIACYSLARRVGYESMNVYGSKVAYQVRFEGTKTDETKILFLTEGVLLRQFAGDPELSMYNVIIVDEVHERHITGDFLLGVLKRLLTYRDDIRVILMSATINAELFSKYFDAPVIEVPGRMYPVSIEYLPNDEEDRNLVDDRLYQERLEADVRQSVASKPTKLVAAPYLRIMEKIDQVVPAAERGDMLVFLSGINEISLLAEELTGYAGYTRRWIILMLHSSLSVEEQEKVFAVAPVGVRKCILSTNIAETSVTIDGVRFIVDSGKVKEMGFDASANLSRLSEFWISQSSAKQRAGRAGRTGPGECYRFYSKLEYERLNEFPVPEILRMPLEPLLLQIRAYGLGDPRDFDFVERPAETSINFSLHRLQQLGALDRKEELTLLGRLLAILPLDVVLGKMLILGSISELIDPIVVLAAALSVQSPFSRVSDGKTDVLERRRALQSNHGDPFTLLNVFSEWLRVKASKESSRNWCKRHGLEEQRLYEMVKLKQQFESVLRDYLGIRGSADISDSSAVKRKRENEKPNWRDPDFIRRREERRMLERRKRHMSAGRRQILKVDAVETDAVDDDSIPTEDISNMSVDALEFSLKHNATDLLNQSDVENLSDRDVNLLKLIICSGLYPHLASPDEANHARKLTDQVFHTRSKRFVSMHPASVFTSKPELIQPKFEEYTKQHSVDGEETLATLHARTHVKEILCYLELLETTKPYLMNVVRVPALAGCLLFGNNSKYHTCAPGIERFVIWTSVDVSPDLLHIIVDEWLHISFGNKETAQKVLVISNYLRVSWDAIIRQKLELVNLKLSRKLRPSAALAREEPPVLLGTTLADHGPPTAGRPVETAAAMSFSDWSDIEFLPPTIKRMHRDWELGMRTYHKGQDLDFEAGEVSAQLSDFLELEVDFTAERLRTQEVKAMFGYDIYISEISKQAAVQVTPHVRYFCHDPKQITRKVKKRLADVVECKDLLQSNEPPLLDVSSTLFNPQPNPEGPPASGEKHEQNRKPFSCSKCGQDYVFTPGEALRHRKTCGRT